MGFTMGAPEGAEGEAPEAGTRARPPPGAGGGPPPPLIVCMTGGLMDMVKGGPEGGGGCVGGPVCANIPGAPGG